MIYPETNATPAHIMKRNYSHRRLFIMMYVNRFIKSVENGIVSLAALGEGWHNYHHVFPWDYRASELGRLNISTIFIDTFAKIGWAYDRTSYYYSLWV